MSVLIGSARYDEKGRLRGGKAGDQTGKEVAIENYYTPLNGWRVLRPKSPVVAERMARNMEWACANKNIGYNQDDNQSLFYEARPYGFNCQDVQVPCNTDCSQLDRVCACYATGTEIPYFYTGNEAEVLISTGFFVEMKGAEYRWSSSRLRRGDTLVTYGKGHTVVVLSDGDKAYIWKTDITILAQHKYGTPVDGEIWGQYTKNKKFLPNAGTGWKFKSAKQATGSTLIKEIQKQLMQYGYTAQLDGIAGEQFVRALQHMLEVQIDGIMGCKTVKAFYYHLLEITI